MKKFIGMALAAVISASSFTAFAAGAIPDHQGTSMDGIEIGTAQLNSAVKSYYDLFEQAGDQYGVLKILWKNHSPSSVRTLREKNGRFKTDLIRLRQCRLRHI